MRSRTPSRPRRHAQLVGVDDPGRRVAERAEGEVGRGSEAQTTLSGVRRYRDVATAVPDRVTRRRDSPNRRGRSRAVHALGDDDLLLARGIAGVGGELPAAEPVQVPL